VQPDSFARWPPWLSGCLINCVTRGCLMRRIRYAVAMSLDGFIAGPNGEADWIGIDPEVDFASIWAQFDTGLMGRRTYETATKRLGEKAFQGFTTIVFSRTMKPEDHPEVTLVSELSADWVETLKNKSGKDIWLFGGSGLFRAFLDAGCVDTVEVMVIPVLLGGGVPLLPPPYSPTQLRLLTHRTYRSGRVSLTYEMHH
jgi:dihydrofolate reductase